MGLLCRCASVPLCGYALAGGGLLRLRRRGMARWRGSRQGGAPVLVFFGFPAVQYRDRGGLGIGYWILGMGGGGLEVIPSGLAGMVAVSGCVDCVPVPVLVLVSGCFLGNNHRRFGRGRFGSLAMNFGCSFTAFRTCLAMNFGGSFTAFRTCLAINFGCSFTALRTGLYCAQDRPRDALVYWGLGAGAAGGRLFRCASWQAG
jgi:hypothetical protein